VRALRPLAPDTLLLHLQTPRSHRLRFLAGQSLTAGLAAGARRRAHAPPGRQLPLRRPQPAVLHCPRDPARCAGLHPVRRRQSSPVTPSACAAPVGEFVLADGHRTPGVCGLRHGFAPIKSLIEHALSLDAAPSFTLFWLATRPDGHFMANQCRAWSEALDQFEYELVTHADRWSVRSRSRRPCVPTCLNWTAISTWPGRPSLSVTVRDELRSAGVAQAQIFAEIVCSPMQTDDLSATSSAGVVSRSPSW
jgi:CDP-4-dehydro-6-deoxyglucose reductase